MAYKRPESVLVVVCNDADEFLLLRRVDRADFWQSVTGSLRTGETPAAAARRELAEETGFSGEALEDRQRRRRFAILPEWRHRFAPGVESNLEHEFRLCLAGRPRPRLDPREHDRAVWLPRAQALARCSSWSNREAIRDRGRC